MLGLLAALENAIPPLPTDAAVALGAFLSHSGVTTPIGVFVVIWLSNIAGAIAVYYLSRRYGRRFFATPAGRRLLAPRALAAIEREYLRFGTVGIFIGRFLPGFRAVVAPFAGLADISPARAIIPMALASALWYGGLTALGTLVGAEWTSIASVLGRINRGLMIAGVAATFILAAWIVWRRRQRARRPLWSALEGALNVPATLALSDDDARRDAAVLLLEIACADASLTAEDRDDVSERLRLRWSLPPSRKAASGREPHPELKRVSGYAARITGRFAPERRMALIERAWGVLLESGEEHADGALLERAGTLLGLTSKEVAATRSRVTEAVASA